MALPNDETKPAGGPEQNMTPVIPDHEMLRQFGSGSSGDVWLARSVIRRYRAVKIIYRRTFESSRYYDKEFTGVEKFEPISRTHEGFVDVLQVGRNDEADYFYYVMELADDQFTAQEINPDTYKAKTLRSEFENRGKLPFDECVKLGLSLTAALSYLHENGLIHRDIKLSNIIFVGGVPKLADIGLVASAAEAKTFCGTEGYIPPEGPGKPQADLYSLGKVLYEASTGKDRMDFPELPTEVGEDFLKLNEVILKACENDPAKRYQTAKQMHADLERLVKGLPLEALRAGQNNLPAQLTSFVGRETEIAEVRKLLKTTRLLTLTGIGGCGKTRLALEVAGGLAGEFPDGVWLVELAALSDPALVTQAVASVLGVREEPNRPLLSTLSDYLRSKQTLLLLDNCEHLIQACAEFAEALLKACPNVRILATSREGLGIGGEALRQVPSLSTPAPNPLPALEQLTGYEAVRLFVERAVEKQLDFAITNDNAKAVAQICKRLDGIPLAIELAAARLSVLSPEQIAERLDDRFRLLTGGSRTALPRQQTLQALMGWSYGLLCKAEQKLLRRLSVFAGGFTLEAAKAVYEDDVLDLLTHLVDKSLVVAEKMGHELRYRLLETLRQYGRDKLLESGESEDAHRRHRDFFLELAERAEPELRGPAQATWFDRLETEYDDFRAALTASQGTPDGGETALRLAGALWFFWHVRGYFTEGRNWLEAALAVAAKAPEARRAYALNGAGVLAYDQSDFMAARRFYEESLALRRTLGDKRGVLSSLNNLSLIASDLGQLGVARQLLEECMTLLRETQEQGYRLAAVLNNLGRVVREQNDYAQAKRFLEEALTIRRRIADQHGIGDTLLNFGVLAREQGQYRQSADYFYEAATIQRALGDKQNLGWTLSGQADLALLQGDLDQTHALYTEALEIFRALGELVKQREAEDTGPMRGVASCLSGLGVLHARRNDPAAAAVAYDEAIKIFRRLSDQPGIASVLDALGSLALKQGDLPAARRHFSECLHINHATGGRRWTARSLETFAVLTLAESDATRAAKLYGAAAAIRETIGAPLPPAELTEHTQHLAEIRRQLGDQAFAATLAEGRALTTEQAVALALGAAS